MTVGPRPSVCAAMLLFAVVGCSHLHENRAIEAFSTALAEQNLGELEQSTSDGFQSKALRSAEALDDLEILKLPTGDVSIVSVEEDSETEKNVVVKVGNSRQKLLYKLVQNEDEKWVVDDIFVRQKRRGHVATRSVTEQMDLLLSVREFLDAWTDGDRDDVLAVAAPELRGVLEELPPAYLVRVTSGISGENEKSSKRPDAQLDGDRALVTLPRTSGNLVVSFQQDEKDTWLVSDLALESRKETETVPSLLKRATALVTAIRFLDRFNDGDKPALAEITTPNFHTRSLEPGDLSSVRLPRPADAAGVHELTMEAHRADFVVPGETEVVKVSLVRWDQEDARGLPPSYRVEEATIYEIETEQEKRLSALFTAQASMHVFAEALRQRNLPILRHTSTADFNRRVWERLHGLEIDDLPLTDVANAPPTIVNTVFRGPVTEITVTQGPRAMTYVLRGRESDLLVDDVLVPATGRPSSLKTTLEHVVPTYLLAKGIANRDLSMVRRSSSDDFNRLVWNQLRSVPGVARTAPSFLSAPPTSVEPGEEVAMVMLGSDRHGAKLALAKERGFWVVNELVMIAGPLPNERIALKQTLRTEVAKLTAPTEPPPKRVTLPVFERTAAKPVRDRLDEGLADEPIGTAERFSPDAPIRESRPEPAPEPRRTALAPARTVGYTVDDIADRPIE